MKREITKKMLQGLLIVAAAIGIYFCYGGTASIDFFQVMVLALLIGLNIIYCSILLNSTFPKLTKPVVVGATTVGYILIHTDHSLDVRPRMLQILIAFVILNFIIYLAVKRKNTFSQQQ